MGINFLIRLIGDSASRYRMGRCLDNVVPTQLLSSVIFQQQNSNSQTYITQAAVPPPRERCHPHWGWRHGLMQQLIGKLVCENLK